MSNAKPYFDPNQLPFQSVPRADRYFPAEAIEEARQRISAVLQGGEGPSLLIGPTGCGKSSLLSVLAAQYADQYAVVQLYSSQICTRRALLQAILYGLNLPYRNYEEGELRLSLQEHLSNSTLCPAGMLLLVDEGHTLPLRLLEELRMLSNQQRDGHPSVRIVLSGNSSLEEHFASPRLESFNQRLATRCYLSPFGYQETLVYIQAQLDAAGFNPSGIFTRDALDAVYRATDGIPRLVNQLCRRVLQNCDLTTLTEPLCKGHIQNGWADLQSLPAPWTEEPLSSNVASTTVLNAAPDETETAALSEAPQTIELSQAVEQTVEQTVETVEFGSLENETSATSSLNEPTTSSSSSVEFGAFEPLQTETVQNNKIETAPATLPLSSQPTDSQPIAYGSLEEVSPFTLPLTTPTDSLVEPFAETETSEKAVEETDTSELSSFAQGFHAAPSAPLATPTEQLTSTVIFNDTGDEITESEIDPSLEEKLSQLAELSETTSSSDFNPTPTTDSSLKTESWDIESLTSSWETTETTLAASITSEEAAFNLQVPFEIAISEEPTELELEEPITPFTETSSPSVTHTEAAHVVVEAFTPPVETQTITTETKHETESQTQIETSLCEPLTSETTTEISIATQALAANPFDETFDEEEIVLESLFPLTTTLSQTAPSVQNLQQPEIATQLEAVTPALEANSNVTSSFETQSTETQSTETLSTEAPVEINSVETPAAKNPLVENPAAALQNQPASFGFAAAPKSFAEALANLEEIEKDLQLEDLQLEALGVDFSLEPTELPLQTLSLTEQDVNRDPALDPIYPEEETALLNEKNEPQSQIQLCEIEPHTEEASHPTATIGYEEAIQQAATNVTEEEILVIEEEPLLVNSPIDPADSAHVQLGQFENFFTNLRGK